MVTRGLWNLHVNGKWYRSFHPPRGRITGPDSPATLTTIKQILSKTDTFDWESIPFPTPLHMDLDYVYTIDEHTSILTVVQWKGVDGVLSRRTRHADLTSIRETSLAAVDHLLEDATDDLKQYASPDDGSVGLPKSFEINEIPAPLNEIQFQLYTDFVFTWRFYFDDTLAWEHTSPLFSSLAIGLLRIAAWDCEVVFDTEPEELPITFSSFPRRMAPSDSVFWFHGYLIVYCNTDEIGSSGALKAKEFLRQHHYNQRIVRVILISIRHIALLEIAHDSISCSSPIPLITNTSALSCSPGFRVLANVLTSYRWKQPFLSTEHWGTTLPTEVFDMILESLAPRDLVSFAQASFVVEEWYYSCISQMYGFRVQQFDLSIPCCGKRNAVDFAGAYCSVCHAWYHAKCMGVSSEDVHNADRYICASCCQRRPGDVLNVGGIHQAYRATRERQGCKVVLGGRSTTLQLRVSKPAHRRPELWLIRSHGPPPSNLVRYAIHFGGAFSGLAYGFDE